MHAAAFVWAFVQLRAGARERLEDELADASVRRRMDRRRRRRSPEDELQPGPDRRAWPRHPPPPCADRRDGRHRRLPSRSRRTATVAAVGGRPRPDADLDAAAASFEDLGVLGWFRARLADLPIRPDRSARSSVPRAADGSTGSTCGSSSCSSSGRWSCGPTGSTSRTRCTSTRSTTRGPRPSSSRTGGTGSRTTSTSGPTHISPSTPWPSGSCSGARTTSPPRASSGCQSSRPRSNRDASTTDAPRDRAGERLHIATGTEIRTYDLRTRDLIAVIGRARRERADDRRGRQAAGRSATRTGISRPWTSGSSATAGSRRGHRADGPRHGRPPHRRTSSSRARLALRHRRIERPADDRSISRRASSVGSLDLPGIADLSLRAAAARRWWRTWTTVG